MTSSHRTFCGGLSGARGARALSALAPLVLAGVIVALPGVAPAFAQTGARRAPHPIVSTGQTQCFGAGGAVIACPATGDPYYGQDAQHPGNAASFSLSGDGLTVRDNVTGLTWMRGPNTTRTRPAWSDKKTYGQAQAWVAEVNAMRYGGFSDWRLPTIKELYSLMNFTGTDPSGPPGARLSGLKPFIDTAYFDFAYGDEARGERLIDSQYASSTVFVVNPAETGYPKLFGLNLADGRIKGYDLRMPDGRTEKTFFVQLVRGPTGYGENAFTDNGDGTVTDAASGLTWSKTDSGKGMTWYDALAWVQAQNAARYLGHDDWRLPNAKELQGLVNYANAPEYNGKPAIDTRFFECTAVTAETGRRDYGYYWTSTTHMSAMPQPGARAVYIAFGGAMGFMRRGWVDVHGAGAQRSDPKAGNPANFPYGMGPQGDAIHIYNFVRLVRDANR